MRSSGASSNGGLGARTRLGAGSWGSGARPASRGGRRVAGALIELPDGRGQSRGVHAGRALEEVNARADLLVTPASDVAQVARGWPPERGDDRRAKASEAVRVVPLV